MQKKPTILSSLKNFFLNSEKKSKRLFVILLSGIMLLLIGQYFSQPKINQPVTEVSSVAPSKKSVFTEEKNELDEQQVLENQYAKQLQEVLEKMANVDDVEVIVKLASTTRKIYEKNYSTAKKETEETDKNNGKRNVLESSSENKVVITKEDGKDVPLIIETNMPEVKGVLVVASGVKNITVKAKVVEAVSRVLDIPSHKVAVMAR